MDIPQKVLKTLKFITFWLKVWSFPKFLLKFVHCPLDILLSVGWLVGWYVEIDKDIVGCDGCIGHRLATVSDPDR